MIDFENMESAAVFDTPFKFLIAGEVLTRAQAAEIRRDYPRITRSGYLPLSRLKGTGAFLELIEDLQSPRLADILSVKLGLDLRDKPRMITVRRHSKPDDGRIHNDSVSKISTMLIYLNEDWEKDGGAIRALNGPGDMDDFAAEVAPVAGNVFAFARSDTSWHGHPPFKGERYVIQVTFLTSAEELERKESRGGMQHLLKKLNPFAG
jgi:SM-20-related protein